MENIKEREIRQFKKRKRKSNSEKKKRTKVENKSGAVFINYIN
jgi:hypothetical protein